MEYRIERDSMGEVRVPADKYWGAQTERSHNNFPIGVGIETMPAEIVHAFGILKKATARANRALRPEKMTAEKLSAIEQAADEVISGKLLDNFPLVVWQTGSGTQSNMNANEVISNRAIELAGGEMGSKKPVHPNDHVNRGQSSNDTFPTAMHIAVVCELNERLYAPVTDLRDVLAAKAAEFEDVIMVGRTHLQDATPIRLGQVIGSWVAQIDFALDGVRAADARARSLAIGGTAVGTGLNAHPKFGALTAAKITDETGLDFQQADNLFAALSAHDSLVEVSGSLRVLAGALMKIANDVRWYASGPRNGIGELLIPENEPGSSIMPGKVNPVIPEVVNQIAFEVIGNDMTVTFAAEAGQLQLNAFEPIIAHSLFKSVNHLRQGCLTLADRCVDGITANRDALRARVENSIGIVTALNPYIGYAAATSVAAEALESGKGVAEIVLARGLMSRAELDDVLRPEVLTQPRALPHRQG